MMSDHEAMEPVVLDFERICRVCKSEEGVMRDLFAGGALADPSCPHYDEMLMACTSLQITNDDGLPALICEQCSSSLKLCYDFKHLCERSDQELRQAAENLRRSEDGNYQMKLTEIADLIDDHQIDKPEVLSEIVVPSDVPLEKCDFIELLDNNQMVLTCKQCFKVFTTIDGLKCHKRVHTGMLFKCKQCDKSYSRMNHLQRHEMTHEKKKVHICRICNKTLTRFEHLKRHLVIHLKDKPFTCEKCTRGFNRAEHLANHADKCKGEKMHICDICNKGFIRKDTLDVHRRQHGASDNNQLTLENLDNIQEHYIEIENAEPELDNQESTDDDNCDDDYDYMEQDINSEDGGCFEPVVNILVADTKENQEVESSGNVETLKIKIQSECEEQEIDGAESNVKIEEEAAVQKYEEDSDSAHSEYLPQKTTPKEKRGRGRPRKHPVRIKGRRGRPAKIKVEVKEEVDEDEEEQDCDEDDSTAGNAGDKVYECTTCKKTFSRSSHLKRHESTHSEFRQFTCDACPKTFHRRDHLMQHIKLHSQVQEYECDVCKKTFTRANHLAKHKIAKHENGEHGRAEKKFKCEVCQKGFTTEKYRDLHMKLHVGDKMFKCKTCEKTFLSKSHLSEHMKFHSESSKKFLCSECGQRFIRNDYLVIHMRRHRGEKPFKCKFCGKGFPRTTDLTVHERYHTGEKTHLCVICGRGFGRAYNLTVHMRTHTGEKPYRCTYCDAAFAQGNDLKAHVRRHTGERFQCDLCPETFIMGYMLTHHKRIVHGLNVVSNIRRLQTVVKENPDEPPPITITLPPPVVPSSLMSAQIHAQIQLAQIQHIVNE